METLVGLRSLCELEPTLRGSFPPSQLVDAA